MKPLTHSIRFWLLAVSTFFSGMTINASTGRGFILLAVPIIALLVLVHLLTHTRYRGRWLAGVCGFIFLSAVNGSRPGSVLLSLIGLVLFESLRESQRDRSITSIDLRWLTWVGVLLALLVTIDFVTGRAAGLWSANSVYGGTKVDLPRLMLFFSEPSYLGVFCVAAFFKLRGHPGFQWTMLLLVFLTQSLFAGTFFLVLLLRRQALLLLVLVLAGLIVMVVTTRGDPSMFFLSSGLIRLVGITQLENMHGLSLWLGHGLGAGDLALVGLFNDFGIQEQANGFLFSLVYDVGLLGMLCLYLAYSRSLFDLVLFNFLLLNFGLGSFLLPVLMFMSLSEKGQAQTSTAPLFPWAPNWGKPQARPKTSDT